MRRVRIVLGLAVAVCAFGALSVPALAKGKEKLVFGEFVASIAGKTITEATPAPVIQNKEDEAELTGLTLGKYKFGVLNSENKPDYEEPCKKPPTVTGKVRAERSSELLTEVTFKECVTSAPGIGSSEWKATSFKLDIIFKSNESAELGNTVGGFEIPANTTELIKGVNSKCTVVVPKQFVPVKAGEKEEKFWEAAEYTPEKEENLENWEKSKKLKEQYPGDFKNRLEIETLEKFKGIRSYVDTASQKKHGGCVANKGEENGKLVTEKEIEVEGKMVENPYYHWVEYTNGKISMNVEGLEIKGGQLTFEPPA